MFKRNKDKDKSILEEKPEVVEDELEVEDELPVEDSEEDEVIEDELPVEDDLPEEETEPKKEKLVLECGDCRHKDNVGQPYCHSCVIFTTYKENLNK